MAKDAYYFSHDSNAKDDPKCMLLIEELQLEGYGIYWLLVEVLREQENYKYPLRMVPVLARKFLTTKEKMLAVIYKYDLFVVENEEFFYSESLNRRMGLMNDKREQARLAGKKSGEARRNKDLEYKEKTNIHLTDDERPFNDCSTDAEQLKESKVKESKINKKESKLNNNKEIYDKYKVLTSKRIQLNFLAGSERRKSIELKKEFLLLTDDLLENDNIKIIDVYINEIDSNISTQKEIESKKKIENESIYTETFNYYLSKENLIKHTKFTEPMKKGIDKVIEIYSLDLEQIKKIIDRHSEKVEQDKNKTEFKTTTRTLSELLGQKKYRSEDYICSDYLDEKYVEMQKLTVEEIKQQSDKESEEKYGF